nr:hypothetical protein [Tanacetum cinerariifolium]
LPPCSAVTPSKPIDSLRMGDEHLDTISATKSDKFIKSYVENLVTNPSESEGENGCDVPSCFTTFYNILFDADYDFESVDDQSLHNEDVSEKIFSNPLFEEEIISIRIDQHHFNAESDLVESMLNRDSFVISSSSKIDLFSMSSSRLLYDNSSPRPPEEFVYENSNAEIESFSPSPIPNEDSDSFMEEIDLFLTPNDPMPPSIEDDDNDSEGDNLFLERLILDDPIPLPDTLDFSYEVKVFLPFFTYPELAEYINTLGWNRPAFYNNGDHDDKACTIAITPDFLITDSLIMGDEHLDTILEKESDELIKSCVENLVQNPSESEDESGCDVPACFTTFSNILFDADYDFYSIDPHHFNAESDLIESMLNRDSSSISSSKIDSLLDEFTGELTLLKSISSGIDETDCDPEGEICLTKRLLYDNSSPRPPEEFVSEISNADIESFSPSPIPIKDSDSFMEEIDLSFTPDDPMPPGIEEDDYDSEKAIF